jgi:hypothetical protein
MERELERGRESEREEERGREKGVWVWGLNFIHPP